MPLTGPRTAPAPGLRAGSNGVLIVPQTTPERRPTMFFSSWLRNRMTNPCANPAQGHRAARFRPGLEILEDRAVPAILNVTTALDVVDPNDGLLSLREAVLQANAT